MSRRAPFHLIMLELLPFLGLAAGLLTTLAGQGGGVFLLLAIALLIGPREALVATSPALLLGNLHRAWICRAAVDRAIATRVILGALPGSIAGGLYAGVAPPIVLKVLVVGMTALAIAKAAGLVRWTPPQRALTAAGAFIGALAATSGGGGLLLAPLLLSTGLSGIAYVGTGAVVAVAIHAGRLLAYGHGGLFRAELVPITAVLAVAILLGNMVGDRLRPRVTQIAARRLEYGTLAVCAGLAVSGVAT